MGKFGRMCEKLEKMVNLGEMGENCGKLGILGGIGRKQDSLKARWDSLFESSDTATERHTQFLHIWGQISTSKAAIERHTQFLHIWG